MAKSETKQARKVYQDAGELVQDIRRKFGEEAITTAGEGPIIQVPAISTGALTLDHALGVWGIPKGRVTEIFGAEGGGKTTLTLSIITQLQRAGGTAAFVDAEHALDPYWARNVGVDVDKLLVSQPDSGEMGLNLTQMLAGSGKVDLVVVDSVAALTPQCEIDGEVGDQHIGAHARLMSQGLRKLVGVTKKSGCAVIFINQIRMKIGVKFGSPETTPGGRALKFYSSVRLDVRRKQSIMEGEEPIGNRVVVKVVKNKVAPPFRRAECGLYFGRQGYPYGIDYVGSVIDLGLEAGLIDKKGSWYSYNEVKLGQGLVAASAFLRESADLLGELEAKLKEMLGIGRSVPIEVGCAESDDSGFDEIEDEE